MTAAEAARHAVEFLEYHPRNIALTASMIRRKNVTVSDYFNTSQLHMPLSAPKSHIDQSPFAEMIMRISAMLSSSAIPVAIFTATQSHMSSVPMRFQKIFTNLKGLQPFPRLGFSGNDLSHSLACSTLGVWQSR
jgi:hypothetical protein